MLTTILLCLNTHLSAQDTSKESKNRRPISIIEVTALSKLSEEQVETLIAESTYELSSPFLGKIKSKSRMAGFDVYELEGKSGNALVVVKDGYIRGGFYDGYSAIYPRSPLATLEDGPFIEYSEIYSEKDGVLVYSNGGDIHIDYKLNGIDVTRKRLNNPEIPFPGSYLVNSFTAAAFINGHHCLAVPSINGMLMATPFACCKNESSGEVDLFYINSESGGEWKVVSSEHVSWSFLKETKDMCINTYSVHKDQSWLPTDTFDD